MYNKLQYGLICRGLNKRAANYWPELGVGMATGLGGYGLSRLFGMGRVGSALVGLLSALGGGYAANRLKGSFGGAPQQSIFDRIQRKVKSIVPEYEITPEDQEFFNEGQEEAKADIVDKQSDSNNPITKQPSDTTSNTSVGQTAQSSTSSTRSKQVSTPMQLKNQQRIQYQQDTAGRQRQNIQALTNAVVSRPRAAIDMALGPVSSILPSLSRSPVQQLDAANPLNSVMDMLQQSRQARERRRATRIVDRYKLAQLGMAPITAPPPNVLQLLKYNPATMNAGMGKTQQDFPVFTDFNTNDASKPIRALDTADAQSDYRRWKSHAFVRGLSRNK